VKFLFDTNILIPAEPTTPDEIEQGHPLTLALIAALAGGRHQLYVHPASLEDLGRDPNPTRRHTRHRLLAKYLVLPAPPAFLDQVIHLFGRPAAGSNDEVDMLLLSAVLADAVDYLVTEDRDLLRDSRIAGVKARVVGVAEALAAVRALFPVAPVPPPAIRHTVAHELPTAHQILDSFRDDYVGFDTWLQKAKREHRVTWIVETPGTPLAGFCIVKDEPIGEFGIEGPALKLCSFKVADFSRGYRFGELLISERLRDGATASRRLNSAF
jgi:hypothetical protein